MFPTTKLLLLLLVIIVNNILISGKSLRQRYLIDTSVLQELDAWELKQLRDFVRGKGRGSVSRFPVELLASEDDKDDDMLNLMDPMLIEQGGIVNNLPAPPSPAQGFSKTIIPTSIIAPPSYLAQMKAADPSRALIRPSSKSQNGHKQPMAVAKVQDRQQRKRTRGGQEGGDEPTKETFKEMAHLFQGFLSRRQEILKQETQGTSAKGQWEPMNPKEEVPMRQGVIRPFPITSEQPMTRTTDFDNLSKEEYEAKLQTLSRQLTEIMALIQKTKDRRPVHQKLPPRPKLIILRNGTAEQTKDGQYEFIATISLIQDEGKNILVDTGMGTDINGRTQLLNKLSTYGLAPPNIHIVVSTHGHLDHNGGVHDFPDAVHYQGWYQHHQSKFNLSGLFEGDRHQLTENVYLLRSPGHSSDDLAIIIKDEENLGSVAIAGDTFIRKEDIDYQMMWKPLSANENQQAESRRRLACGQWRWIVPGHGPPFPLEQTIRSKFGC